MRCRAAAWLLLIAATAFATTAGAQQANTPGAANSGGERNGNGAKNGDNGKSAYQDILIDDGALEPDIWTGEVPEHDARGLPRGLRLDGIYSNISRNGVSSTQYGAGIASESAISRRTLRATTASLSSPSTSCKADSAAM